MAFGPSVRPATLGALDARSQLRRNWQAPLHSVRQRTDRARSDPYPGGKYLSGHGSFPDGYRDFDSLPHAKGKLMNNIIYIVGLIVVVVAVLSFFGLR